MHILSHQWRHVRKEPSGIKLRILHFPDTPVGAQKWGAKLLPVRVRTSKLADNSYARGTRHSSYPLVCEVEIDREVVSRPTCVLPLRCPGSGVYAA